MTSLCWEVYSGTSDKGPSEIGMTSLQDTNRWPHVQRFHCIVIGKAHLSEKKRL